MIIQIGNRDNHPDDKKSAEILKDFCDFIQEKYPNIFPIGIYLHMDEFSIDDVTGERIYSPAHIHFDFVFIAHLGNSLKTGMDLQCSMSGALAEMGFKTSKGKGTAQTQFEEAVRHDLQDFAEERGLLIDRTLGKKHKHQDKDIYQFRRDIEKRAARVQSAEATVVVQKQQIDEAIELLEQRKEEYDRYTEVSEEVRRSNMTIDSEADRLSSDSTVPFSSRLSRFVNNVKKIGTKVVTELNRYKNAFNTFGPSVPKNSAH